jgi:glycosyltransferase involved in cell wall biosynthesis
MKILIVPDVPNWAIGKLAEVKVKYNSHHTFRVEYIHPRDAVNKADYFEQVVKEFNPQIIHYEYFRTCAELIKAKPFLKNYPSVLTHHNQRGKALGYADWNKLGIDMLVVHTEKNKELLNERGYWNVRVINHGINLDYFTYQDKEPEQLVIGYTGRVVPWKGLKEITEIAEEFDYPVQILGKMDKADYWQQIRQEVLRYDFFGDNIGTELVEAYRNMTIYVGFSEDGYEEGPLGLLEAMACGVPVITTRAGIANDIIEDGKNGLLIDFKDKDGLREKIRLLMEDKELRETLRKNAWQTVKHMSDKKMAYEYSTLYNEILNPDSPLISVIIPTYNRKEQIIGILDGLRESHYKFFEAVICDDNSSDGTEDAIREFQKVNPEMTIKFLQTNRDKAKDNYNLAMARNMGAVEAEGSILVFCDSRLRPEKEALGFFKDSIENVSSMSISGNKKIWFFGNKGSNKKSFVENFSAVSRNQFVNFGMFNERIDRYGGMSQELRTRWQNQGGEFHYLEDARAEEITRATSIDKRRKEIIDMKFKLFKMYNNNCL